MKLVMLFSIIFSMNSSCGMFVRSIRNVSSLRNGVRLVSSDQQSLIRERLEKIALCKKELLHDKRENEQEINHSAQAIRAFIAREELQPNGHGCLFEMRKSWAMSLQAFAIINKTLHDKSTVVAQLLHDLEKQEFELRMKLAEKDV